MTDGAPLRIGLLGAARITELALVTPARESGDRLVAVAARDARRAAEFAERHGVERALGSYAELLADPEVELVYNPLANALHGPLNLRAIAAGKHVLTEKPSASNAEEAREVRDAAAAAGVRLLEAFHHVHHPVTRRLHALLDEGELGELRRVEAVFDMPAPAEDDPRWSLELAGGALMDVGCYSLHVARSLAPWAGGPPSVVCARGAERAGRPGVDEWMTAELAFPGGATAAASCSMVAPEYSITARVVGTRGEAAARCFARPDWDDRVLVRTDAGERVEELGRRSSYAYQLDAVRAHLRAGAPFPADADDAVAQAELIDEVYRAAGFAPRPSQKGSA